MGTIRYNPLKLGESTSLIERWSRRWLWRHRVEEYDRIRIDPLQLCGRDHHRQQRTASSVPADQRRGVLGEQIPERLGQLQNQLDALGRFADDGSAFGVSGQGVVLEPRDVGADSALRGARSTGGLMLPLWGWTVGTLPFAPAHRDTSQGVQ